MLRDLAFGQLFDRLARLIYAHDSRLADHYLHRVYPHAAPPYLIVYERRAEEYWRVAYTVSDDDQVTIADRDDWTQVVQQWQPVSAERLAELEAAKRALMDETAPEAEPASRSEPATDTETRAADVASPAAASNAVVRTAQAGHRMASDANRSTFLIMTEAVARDGISVNPDGVDTTAFMRNPVVLWMHGKDARRGAQPIGRVVSLVRRRSRALDENGFVATVEWYDDEFSQAVKRQYKEGYLSAVSFSWLPLERTVIRMDVDGQRRRVPRDERSEMLELSAVGVGGDAHALALERDAETDETDFRAIIREELTAFLSNGPSPGDSDEGNATDRATAPAAPDDSSDEATASSPAPAVPVRQTMTLSKLHQARQQRRERALLEANKRLGRA